MTEHDRPGRRRWLRCAGALMVQAAASSAAGCAAAGKLGTAAADASPAPGSLLEVADGVFMLTGSPGEISPANRGRVGNAGFIVGPEGVLVIDSGVSHRQGLELLAVIRQMTDKPVRELLLTHARQEFLFGATAFRAAGVPIRMHEDAADLMRSRCDGCLHTLQRVLGEDEMRGSAVISPDRRFRGELSMHPALGRAVRILDFGHSSGPGDVAVLDEPSGVLFAGGLVDCRRIPDVQDAELAGWHAALGRLAHLPVQRVVPGHGPLGDPACVTAVDDYLRELHARIVELVEGGVALSEVARAATLARYADWDQYDTVHRRNASVLFVKLERDLVFGQDARPAARR